MLVQTAAGAVIDLGVTEVTPTISITDYSSRVTDDFGVTTVVERGFARRMSVRLALPSDQVDAVQKKLADLRASSALWIADDRFAWLSVQGFYKDFDLDLAVPPLSFCRLTIEGLAGTEPVYDDGSDPAPAGQASTMRLLQPLPVEGQVLVSSNVPENDHPEWAAAASYPLGARVIRQSTHRVYESAVDNNLNSDPASALGQWIDVGPTNRWAMFDQALGSVTAASSISVTLAAGTVTAVALLDVTATTVRVQTSGYDRTQAVSGGSIRFLDMPASNAQVTVTVSGGTQVSVGTLLIGKVVQLGVTEASPTAGITDFSRKETDAFGEMTVVERAWAKRMTTHALIRTEAVDLVANRIAAVRALPSLWIGQEGLDSLTVYGFFKDFSIEVGEKVAMLSLSIEGLSTAAPIAPSDAGSVAWPDVTDPVGTRPTDNATNTADPAAPFGLGTVGDQIGRVRTLERETIPAINAAVAEASGRITAARSAADQALANIVSEATRIDQRIDTLVIEGGGDGYDDTAVRAEISRVETVAIGADVALGQRIDTVSATLTTKDGEVRALITTKETAAVSRENAISQRVDQLIAEGGGGSEGVDTVARAEILRVEQASVLRDTSLGSVSTQISASADGASGALNANQSFAIVSAGQALPTGYSEWPAANGRASKGAEGLTIDTGTAEGGVVQHVTQLTPGGYVIEARVKRHQFASFLNTGIAIHLLDDNGQPTGRFIDYHFFEDASFGVQDRWQTFSRYVEVPDFGYLAGRAFFHVMGRWSSLSGGAASTNKSTWAFARVRAASAGEIKAQKADVTLIPALSARIQTTEDAFADLPNRYATAQRASNIEAAVGNVGSRINSLETVTSNGTFATASRTEQIASYAGDIGAVVNQQSGTIAELGVRQAAYWRVLAVAGNNRAQLTVSADANGGAGIDIVGDVAIDGNLTVTGTMPTRAVVPNAITNTVAISGMSGAGVSAGEGDAETGRLSITSTGGTMKVDIQSDGMRTDGSGLMTVQLVAAYNGTEAVLSREVAFAPSNTAVPVSFFQITSFAAGTVVQFFLRYIVRAANTTWNYNSAAIAVTEFKR